MEFIKVNQNKALRNVNVRLAKNWVEEALKAAENGDYRDMMTCIRLAARAEKEVLIMGDE